MKLWPFGKSAGAVRGNIENPNTPLTPAELSDVLHAGAGSAGRAGAPVSAQTAMQVSAVYSCIGLIAETIASLPLGVYSKDGKDRKRESDHPLDDILSRSPNPVHTPIYFWQFMVALTLLHGNAYANVVRNGRGDVIEMWPLLPGTVMPMRKNRRNKYKVQLVGGGTEERDQDNILHIAGLGFDGLKGMSVVGHVARNPINLALSAEAHGTSFYDNAALPSGIIERDIPLEPGEEEELRKEWRARYQGSRNAGEPMVLDAGVKWTAMTMPNTDAQFLETRKFEIEEIARIYRVPLHMIQQTEKSTSWGTGIEEQTLAFITFTLRPWLVRIEQEINRKFLSGGFYSHFNAEALLRGNSSARGEFYSKAIGAGVMTPNEARAKEDLPQMDGADRLFYPVNTAPIDKIDEETEDA